MKRFLPLLAIAAAGATHAASDENLAGSDKSRLPSGSGIAAKIAAGSEISDHESVIYANGFEQEGDWKKAWDEARDKDGKVLKLVTPPGEDPMFGRRCLQVTATLGENTGGGATKWFESNETLFVRFYTRFDEGCDYVHHFVTLRANRGLSGADRWSGFGGAGLKPTGSDRFSTALEPWGDWGRNTAPGRWNFYSYWHEMKAAPDKKYWGNQFKPEGQADIVKGKWICCEFMIKHNTPGKHDGEQAFWIDGELRGHWGGISWRTTPGLMANALTLESYVTDRWTKNKTNIVYFDNLVVAKQYIGPAKQP
ncbi:MAG: hypothetical protein ACR2RV_07230 [Verrucomicrobiales bacterium]